MLDLLIFTQYPKTYGPKRLYEEALKLGLNCKIKSYSNTDLNDLPEAKYVIFREPTSSKNIYDFRDKLLNTYISHNSKILNCKSYLAWSILDKKTQETEFKKGNIPTISEVDPTIAKYPFIAKSKLGSHGSHVFKIENKDDLDKVLLKHKAEDLLCQEFQTSGFDLRAIVLGDRVLGIMKRTPKKGEFLSNFSQGGEVEKFKVNDIERINIEQIAIKTAKHFELEFVGVDLMMGNSGEWKVLEVNRACQFKGFERALGTNVALSILNYLIN
ncbi:MAG: ATP-grasp domain-containing protein [bacterium]|nr:MAG: ATP-grasp domain-containing protein [bacterium]